MDWIDNGWHALKGFVLIGIVLFLILLAIALVVPKDTPSPQAKAAAATIIDDMHKVGVLKHLDCTARTASVSRAFWLLSLPEQSRLRAALLTECETDSVAIR